MSLDIEFPKDKKKKGLSKNLVDKRAETGLNFRSMKQERIRDRKQKNEIDYKRRKEAYLNRTEGQKEQRRQDSHQKESVGRAVSRRLSPLEKTAMVAGSNSTHEYGVGIDPKDVLEELLSKQNGQPVSFETSISRRIKRR